MTEIGQEWQTSILRDMDFCRAIARFKIAAPNLEITQVLARKPDLEATVPEGGDGFDKPLQQFMWLRRCESKALEKEMIAPFQHADSGESVGGLATLRVYSDRVVLEAFSRQKYDFARRLLEQWFGTQLKLEAESIEDVAMMSDQRHGFQCHDLHSAGGEGTAQRRAPARPLPSHLPRTAGGRARGELTAMCRITGTGNGQSEQPGSLRFEPVPLSVQTCQWLRFRRRFQTCGKSNALLWPSGFWIHFHPTVTRTRMRIALRNPRVVVRNWSRAGCAR